MRSPVPAARFLVPFCLLALSVSPSGGVEPLPRVKKVEVIQGWTGQLPDEALQKLSPPPAESPPVLGIGIPGAMPGSEGGADASGDAGLGPALVEIAGVAPNQGIFAAATRSAPVVIRSEREAAHHFGADELAKLVREVDFSRQFVLVFAWRGSGQDRMDAAVAESFPEKVFFRHLPGRTRDLRPHMRIFALRNGVTWRAH